MPVECTDFKVIFKNVGLWDRMKYVFTNRIEVWVTHYPDTDTIDCGIDFDEDKPLSFRRMIKEELDD